ncbi:mRNA splicing protein sme1 [Kluyveromyces marxianus]|uniref:Small nuclear ribonucleoprotein E n=2 Tax=Kluyveromyces marxianus TaxID=4911 RepID=W0TAX1_KLUMD|nr:small nuclear ribonucleoprotein E [Kluyveromyces marxianus DMKU3-1042]KAG0675763.1 mRNA splicing protein sme1 [Kluyveromyces marxianus]KAG0685139.1 mRNA splicing protein sme1 [Kluyveromyces marxianus]QGN15654.1 small nuclear ribonucleoprotein E [Kluyveromyces marxianus]BAO39941.1 small nuclear ribonucleoprotein E [Kluyveromyces marxianus DMKU3-1042]
MSNSQTNTPMVPPINCIYNYLHHQTTVTFWLYEQVQTRIRGKIRGFDEFMNVVIDEAVEVPVDPKTGKEHDDKAVPLGRIMLKGDNITLVVAN